MKPITLYPVKDNSEKYYTKKGHLFDIPFKVLSVGRSHISGKTTNLLGLLLDDDPRLYRNDFKGENIYLFSKSYNENTKQFICGKLKMLVEEKEIPESNIFENVDNDVIEALNDNITEEYIQAVEEGERPPNVLYIFDDCGNETKIPQIERIFTQMRHALVSVFILGQKYTQMISTTCRENATGLILFKSTDKQLDAMAEDNNYFENKNDFKKLFKTLTNAGSHTPMYISYSNKQENFYMNHHFQPVGKCGKVKGEDCHCLR